jgi:hypothetical protein
MMNKKFELDSKINILATKEIGLVAGGGNSKKPETQDSRTHSSRHRPTKQETQRMHEEDMMRQDQM